MSTATNVESIFFDALAKNSDAERDNFLRQACGGDTELRCRVERLLVAHAEAADFLTRPAVACSDFASAQLYDPPTFNYPVTEREPETSRDPASEEVGGKRVGDVLAFLEPPTRFDSLGRLGHYDIQELLGKGSFGTVVKAFDEKLHRPVAIKIMSPFLATSESARRRFLREARSAAGVRQENVVAIYAVEEGPIPFLVMECIAGQTLQQRMDAVGPMELRDVLRIGHQIACGLAAAHARRLVHRDIKPGNILLDHSSRTAQGYERVSITDFGLARAADDASISQLGLIAGTPMYMAPEQAKGELIDQRVDLFSLGSVLYLMCTGRPPFQATNTLGVLKRVTEEEPCPIREIVPSVPEWLCDLIHHLHAKRPEDRRITAQEVADLLARRLAELQHSERLLDTAVTKPAPVEVRSPVVNLSPRMPKGRWLQGKLGRRAMIAPAMVLLLAGGLGITEATAITNFHGTIIRLFSPEGILVVEVEDPNVSVQIDGDELVITGAGVKEIRLKPGPHTIETTKDGKLVRRDLITIINNRREVVRVTRESLPEPGTASARELGGMKAGERSVDPHAWERTVSGLTAMEQVKAVASRLQQLNPGFDGEVATTIENGVVTGLKFQADHVTDISPVRVLSGLKSLDCAGSDAFPGQWMDSSPAGAGANGHVKIRTVGRTQLADLSPLKGLALTRLNCVNSNVTDLSPLQGMPLTTLLLGMSKVTDLSPVEGMPLVVFDCAYTMVSDLTPLKGMRLSIVTVGPEVSDLSPLAGMPLVKLVVGRGVTDLSPLKGMPLTELDISGARVSDLSPLGGMPLAILAFGDTQVADVTPLRDMLSLRRMVCSDLVSNLSPLKNLPLEYLRAGPLVTDLSPLQGMPLNKFEFMTFQPERDATVLRSIKTLETFNDRPAAEVWKEVDAGNGG